MLNKHTPREHQCCGNCTAFLAMAQQRQPVPGVGEVEMLVGVCCANPPVMLAVPVQTRSALSKEGGQVSIVPQPYLPPRRQIDWCRDGWELNRKVQMKFIEPGHLPNVQQADTKPN